MNRSTIIALALAVFLGMIVGSAAKAETSLPSVSGVVGMTPVTDSSYAAVWVPVAEGQALSGAMWYNNDGLAVFPRVLIASGAADQPASVEDCVTVGEAVVGISSGWSTVELSEPVTSDRGGFYLMFQFPQASVQTGTGAGSGAGLGYCSKGGCQGWMSVDGEEWVRIGRSYGFAVVPQFVAAAPGMLSKSMAGGGEDAPAAKTIETTLLPAVPNPFNPTTDFRFSVKSEGAVSLGIYDLRGRKVLELANEVFTAGEHTVRWGGRDSRGQRVPSGVYFVRMQTKGQQFTQRVTLVK